LPFRPPTSHHSCLRELPPAIFRALFFFFQMPKTPFECPISRFPYNFRKQSPVFLRERPQLHSRFQIGLSAAAAISFIVTSEIRSHLVRTDSSLVLIVLRRFALKALRCCCGPCRHNMPLAEKKSRPTYRKISLVRISHLTSVLVPIKYFIRFFSIP